MSRSAEAALGRSWPSALLCALAAAACYANSFSVPFLFDDPLPREPLPYRTRPLVSASFALNRAWSGGQTWSYHLFNVLVHLGCGLLLLGIVRRTLARAAPELDARTRGGLALVTALVWLCHPLQTESVTYLSQRAEALGAFFILACTYAFLRALDSARPRPWQGLVLVALVLGFAAKETAATAPVLLLAYDATFVEPGLRAAWRRRKGFHLAVFATALAAFLFFVAFLLFGASSTVGFELGFGALDYARTQPGVILHYLRLAFWPHPLVFDYDWPIARSLWAWLPQTLALAALVGAALWLLLRRAWVGFAALWFFSILAPTSSVVPIQDPAFEHRVYLSLAGLVAALVVGGWWACARLAAGRRWLPRALSAVLVAALSATTVARNQEYQSVLGLWQSVVARAPHNERAYANVASGLLAAGRREEAGAALDKALECDPRYHQAFSRLASAHQRRGEHALAILYLERAVSVSDDPAYRSALGQSYFASGDFARAEAQYRRVVEREPSKAETRAALAGSLARLAREDEAIAEYREALRLSPDLEGAHVNLAALCLARGNPEQALVHDLRALEIPPNTAEEHFNLGQCLLALERAREALASFREASRLAPELAEPYAAAAKALCTLSDATGQEHAEALRLARRANDMTQSKRADVLETLALAHATNGELEPAITCIEQALELPGPRRNAEFRQRLEAQLERYRAGR